MTKTLYFITYEENGRTASGVEFGEQIATSAADCAELITQMVADFEFSVIAVSQGGTWRDATGEVEGEIAAIERDAAEYAAHIAQERHGWEQV